MLSPRHIALATLLQIGSTQREIGLWIDTISETPTLPEMTSILARLPITSQRRTKLHTQMATYEQAQEAVIKMIDRGGDIVLSLDSDFPEALSLADHLHIFWIRGDRSLLERPMMSIVGTRDASNYSKKALSEIVPRLVSSGHVIVSGGAKGCDRIAHETTLDAGGQTIAVFGTGIDRSYPSDHKGLFERILAHGGLLISQFALGTPPEPHQFPMRNEIVALLGSGLLVSEAQEKSGSLITARLALDYGKEVFALPGSLYDPLSRGTNLLIQNSEAKLVLTADDILNEIGGDGIAPTQADPTQQDGAGHTTRASSENITLDLSPELQRIYDALDRHAGKSIDTITGETSMTTLAVCDGLAELEIEGYISLSPRGYVRS